MSHESLRTPSRVVASNDYKIVSVSLDGTNLRVQARRLSERSIKGFDITAWIAGDELSFAIPDNDANRAIFTLGTILTKKLVID